MIRLIENNLTKNKHVVNFMDHFGKVLGFKPEPDGFPISWRLYDEELNELCNEDECSKFLQDYLKNLPYTFGEYTVMKCEQNRDENLEELSIQLIPDNSNEKTLLLIVDFFAQGFYTAEFSLNPQDKEFFNSNKLTRVNSAEEYNFDKIVEEYDKTIADIQKQLSTLKNLKTKIIKSFVNKERFLH